VVLSVVVPMYKEAARVGETLADLVATLAAGGVAAEVILVDDGSPDSTVAVVQPWLTEIPKGNLRRVVLVRHAVNRGKGAAVRTGLAVATGTWILMMDADNAARVREVERLWPSTRNESSLVCGSRNTRDARVRSRVFRRLSGGIFRLALGMLGLNLLRDTQCGFKLYRADVARAIVKLGREDRFAFDLEHLLIASRLGPIVEVGIAWEHKDGGTVSPVRDGLKMLREAARIRWRFMTASGLDRAAVRTASRVGAIGEIEAKPQPTAVASA
jgi:dolichyl-phosphate beta-glucosyltransferase